MGGCSCGEGLREGKDNSILELGLMTDKTVNSIEIQWVILFNKKVFNWLCNFPENLSLNS